MHMQSAEEATHMKVGRGGQLGVDASREDGLELLDELRDGHDVLSSTQKSPSASRI